MDARGPGALAPQQGWGVWGAKPPRNLLSSDLSKFIFDQFGGQFSSIWGYFEANFNQKSRGKAKGLVSLIKWVIKEKKAICRNHQKTTRIDRNAVVQKESTIHTRPAMTSQDSILESEAGEEKCAPAISRFLLFWLIFDSSERFWGHFEQNHAQKNRNYWFSAHSDHSETFSIFQFFHARFLSSTQQETRCMISAKMCEAEAKARKGKISNFLVIVFQIIFSFLIMLQPISASSRAWEADPGCFLTIDKQKCF